VVAWRRRSCSHGGSRHDLEAVVPLPMAELAAARRQRLPSQAPLDGFTTRQRRLAIVPGTTRARQPTPSCLGMARHEKWPSCRAWAATPSRGTTRPPSCLIGSGRIGSGQIVLGRPARVEYYSQVRLAGGEGRRPEEGSTLGKIGRRRRRPGQDRRQEGRVCQLLAFAPVTTPPEIIPYYRLNHPIRSLSDNKESSR
jgi:hypothetical protein